MRRVLLTEVSWSRTYEKTPRRCPVTPPSEPSAAAIYVSPGGSLMSVWPLGPLVAESQLNSVLSSL